MNPRQGREHPPSTRRFTSPVGWAFLSTSGFPRRGNIGDRSGDPPRPIGELNGTPPSRLRGDRGAGRNPAAPT